MRRFDGTLFARKLIRPFGNATKGDVENEVKAITEICATTGHDNIIAILGHGPVPATDYYYIDMELCDVNLADYISPSYDRTILIDPCVCEEKSPVFVEEKKLGISILEGLSRCGRIFIQLWNISPPG